MHQFIYYRRYSYNFLLCDTWKVVIKCTSVYDVLCCFTDISCFINNVIYGLTLSPISTVYAITSIGIGIAVGVLHANGWFSSARRVFVSAIIIAIVSAVISTPLNVIFWGGQTGIAWGDSLFAVMVANHAPVWLASFTDEFVLDILDKVCVAYLAFFIYRQLPKRMVHFFSGDK